MSVAGVKEIIYVLHYELAKVGLKKKDVLLIKNRRHNLSNNCFLLSNFAQDQLKFKPFVYHPPRFSSH